MRDSQHDGQTGRSGDELSALARSVVARLAARTAGTTRPIRADLLLSMVRAFGSPDPALLNTLAAEIRRARIGEAELVDSYYPAVARQLGCDWADDRAGWAEVSIAVARLQSAVHRIARGWDTDVVSLQDAPAVLVVLPEGEQHSFGAQVLAAQLRRQGVAADLQIAARPDALRKLMRDRHYDCALISVGREEGLEFSRKLVKSLKDGSRNRLWVAVGGAVLDRPVDVLARTGADMVSLDALSVLACARARAGQPESGAGIAEKADRTVGTEWLEET